MARPRTRRTSRRKPVRRGSRVLERAQKYNQSLKALHLMRNQHMSLSRAAREVGVSRGTVRRYVGRALKQEGRHYIATRFDRLRRTLRFWTVKGPVQILVTDSRTASTVGRYMATVKRYLADGNARALRSFTPKSIRAGKVEYFFVLDPKEIERLAKVGVIDFTELYVDVI
jgi:predicted DNA-binding protein (UPF0251 family)